MSGEISLADGDVMSSTEADLIDQQLVIQCTSTTRPTGVEGRLIFETDTDKLMIYDGTTWRSLGDSAWHSFTPSISGLTIGNGTLGGGYRYIGGALEVHFSITFGSTTAVSGSLVITHPNSAVHANAGTASTLYAPLGVINMRDDTGGAQYPGLVVTASTTTATLFAHTASGTYLTNNVLSSTVPFTWATSDSITGHYWLPVD